MNRDIALLNEKIKDIEEQINHVDNFRLSIQGDSQHISDANESVPQNEKTIWCKKVLKMLKNKQDQI